MSNSNENPCPFCGEPQQQQPGKLYAERDLGLTPLYMRHLAAMTAEKLHDKSAIAAELAWRDGRIEELQRERDALKEEIRISDLEDKHYDGIVRDAHAERDAYKLAAEWFSVHAPGASVPIWLDYVMNGAAKERLDMAKKLLRERTPSQAAACARDAAQEPKEHPHAAAARAAGDFEALK